MNYDISCTIDPTLAVWPGDTPFSFQQVLNLNAGDSVNLTTLTLSAHGHPFRCAVVLPLNGAAPR
jgi:kynurenine formamidase